MAEPDELRLWKYLELPQAFQMKASEIDIISKQHLRICEKLATHLAKQHPAEPKEFERVEYMKDFVLKSADLNEKTIDLLHYVKSIIQEIADDVSSLREGAALTAKVKLQGEKIMQVMKERDELQDELNQLKHERRKDTATT